MRYLVIFLSSAQRQPVPNLRHRKGTASKIGHGHGTNLLAPHFLHEAATRCSTQRLSRIAKGRKTRRLKRRLSRVAMVAASLIFLAVEE
jgi:hypothetical protein